ncbi:MAG: hypothetical protein ACTH4J_14515 [Vibrio toranzoniae]|uniref:hypothetical protein n=1 Tax=Vibrio toranzoniae TaxID=1194427 RepID=UPI003F97895F
MSQKKFTMPSLTQGNPFLKTPDEVVELFGFPTSPRSKVKLVSGLLGQEVKISDRSLDNLAGKGISERKAKEALEPLIGAIEERLKFDTDSFIPVGTRISDIHIQWSAAINCFLCGAQFSEQEESCLQPLRVFLERRCVEYEPQRELIMRYRGMEQEEALYHLTDYYRPVIDKTLLDSKQVALLIKVLDKISLGDEVNAEQDEINAFALFSHDFNLSLFASLDLVARNFGLLVYDDVVKQDESFFTQLLEAEGQCYFGKLLTLIKIKTGCTYSKLAQFIPIQNRSTDSGRTESEAKVERLKEWRKGKTKPSFTVMDEFFSYFDVGDQLPLLIYGLICQAIDRMMEKYKLKGDRAIVQKIYSAENYARYYKKEKLAASLSTATRTIS